VFKLGQTIVPNSAHRHSKMGLERPLIIPQPPYWTVFGLTLKQYQKKMAAELN
jgi:hypothetical protein